MAVFQRQQVGIREIGGTVSIPNHPVAKAMYYLKCICDVLDLSEGNSNLQKFTDYNNYWRLTEEEIDGLSVLVVSVKPEALLGKCLFHDEEVCGSSNNKFFELQDVRQNMVIVNDILIAGQHRRVNRIMFYKRVWLDLYIVQPLVYLGERLKRRLEAAEASRNARPAITYQSTSNYRSYQPQSSCCTIL